MLKEAIEFLKQKKDLNDLQIRLVFNEIFKEEMSSEEIIEFLLLWRDKGYTSEEISSAVRFLFESCHRIKINKPYILDVCGTGGDKKFTFSVSTVVSLVASASGLTVAKHGNRSVSSKCGSADILEALGVNINMDKEIIKKCLEEINIAFIFAPNFHPLMKKVSAVRKKIGTDTIFNLLGPLINPLSLTHQLVGIYDSRYLETIIYTLKNLGRISALVVCSEDGLDEISLSAKTFIFELQQDRIRKYEIYPEDFGFKRISNSEIVVNDIEEDKIKVLEVLEAKKTPCRDIVLLNSGFALYIGGRTKSVREGIELAEELLDSKKALRQLELLREYSYG